MYTIYLQLHCARSVHPLSTSAGFSVAFRVNSLFSFFYTVFCQRSPRMADRFCASSCIHAALELRIWTASSDPAAPYRRGPNGGTSCRACAHPRQVGTRQRSIHTCGMHRRPSHSGHAWIQSSKLERLQTVTAVGIHAGLADAHCLVTVIDVDGIWRRARCSDCNSCTMCVPRHVGLRATSCLAVG